MPRLGTDGAINAIIPIAPFNEQKRIVQKIESLMVLCDKLEEYIEESKKCSGKLMESIVKNI